MRQNYRYKIMTMMVIMVIINYIDRGAISYGQGAIIQEFGFDKIAWGAVLGYFGYGYLFGSLFGGILSDKKGPKFVWMVIGISWSIFVMATAIAGNVGQALFGGSALAGFAMVRILFGFSEGPMFSTINKTNANWAAPKERGIAASIGLLGTPLGALLTAPVAVGLLSIASWKFVFILLGALGFVWIIIWSKMFKDMPEDHSKVSKDELARIRSKADLLENETIVDQNDNSVKWYHFFKNPTLIFNAIGYFAFQYVNFLLLTWTPKYLQDQFGFQLSSLWYLGMIPWVGAIFTVLIGGKISDALRAKNRKPMDCPFRTCRCFLISDSYLLYADSYTAQCCRRYDVNVPLVMPLTSCQTLFIGPLLLTPNQPVPEHLAVSPTLSRIQQRLLRLL